MRARLVRGLIAMAVAVSTAAVLQLNPTLLLVENPIVGAGNYLNVPGPRMGLTVGEVAPSFTLTTLDGEKIQLVSLRGKVVVLDFMASWCIPCQQQMPHLKKVYEKYRDGGLVLISIDADPKESYQDLTSFRSRYAAQWAFAMDNGRVAPAYGVDYIPMTYIIDRGGVMRFKHLGFMDSDALALEIEKYL